MNKEPSGRGATFSVVAYLAAVAVGCLVVGALIPLGYGAIAPIALLAGFLPGLLMCLPGTLLSFQISKRFRLFRPVWYGAFGAMTGMSVGVVFVMAWRPDITSGVFAGLIFATAGAAAGLTYRWVETREADYRTKIQGDHNKLRK